MDKIKTIFKRIFSKDSAYWLLLYLVVRPFKYSSFLSDKFILKIMYRCELGRSLNLKEPKTFNEKLQWLKLNVKNPLYPTLVDKIKAKEYVGRIIGNQYIIPTYQTANKFEDLDFSSLPEKFVIKANHDSGSVYVCKSKKSLEEDRKEQKERFNKSLRRNYYYAGRASVYW